MKKTCVVILTYNNSSDTLNCIRSVLEFNSAPVKFIVIDNGSDNDERKSELKEEMAGLFGDGLTIMTDADCEASGRLSVATLLLSSTNNGYASGNNKGLHLTFRDDEIDNVLILNNDILFVEDIIPRLLKHLADTPDAAIVSPLLY
ncbi:MAG: glycosyltransferase, partial [Muribaculaceae bacterium]|nr:glycosyltransferase [Muribaculaceae bacterium]